jgi:hypothetical protein
MELQKTRYPNEAVHHQILTRFTATAPRAPITIILFTWHARCHTSRFQICKNFEGKRVLSSCLPSPLLPHVKLQVASQRYAEQTHRVAFGNLKKLHHLPSVDFPRGSRPIPSNTTSLNPNCCNLSLTSACLGTVLPRCAAVYHPLTKGRLYRTLYLMAGLPDSFAA